ncbi:MAG TPA: hypothetical protein VNQ32_05275 [Steroidobacteraceae bacterium]|nr:hypothetical protein [Steroidobacteraceae bacterium]
MVNRDRTDPLRSAQNEIFRGIDESRGSLLNSQGGTRGSDVGNTKPRTENEPDEGESPSRIPGKKKP